jgi:hypothetical protein
LRRFAWIAVPPPRREELEHAIDEAAGHDPTAASAAKRLLGVEGLGAGVFLVAARHAAARNAAAPTYEATLARELHQAYVEPLLADEDARRLAWELLGT